MRMFDKLLPRHSQNRRQTCAIPTSLTTVSILMLSRWSYQISETPQKSRQNSSLHDIWPTILLVIHILSL